MFITPVTKYLNEVDYDYVPETKKPLAYLLLHSGYLTVKRTAEGYFFKIPNYEVKAEFTRVVGSVLE
ncbi:MAG: hypothetical protein MRQ07_05740 [Candidatus Midichloria sp.]|nr:hypothetical protein [Candidatus Midichloria sp.]